MTTRRCGSQTQLERLIAGQIAAGLQTALQLHGQASLALPGGRSISGVLRHLAQQQIEWRAVTLIPADERCLPHGDSERNWHIVERELLQPLRARAALELPQSRPFRYQPERADWGLDDFRRSLALPRHRDGCIAIDVVVLGAGEDGHVASLFPGSAALFSDADDYLSIDNSPKPPARRITLGPRAIRGCATAIVLFFGAAKREAARAFSDPALSREACPARLICDVENSWAYADRLACPAEGDWQSENNR